MINPKWKEYFWKHSVVKCRHCLKNYLWHLVSIALVVAATFTAYYLMVGLMGILNEPLPGWVSLTSVFFLCFMIYVVGVSLGEYIVGRDPHHKDMPKFWIKKKELETTVPKKVEVDI